MAQLIRNFVALRWRLLRGSLRGKGTEKVGVIVSTIASVLVGVGIGLAVGVSGRTVADDENLFVLFCVVAAFGVLGVSVVTGVTQPVDPRVIAAEPLSDRERAIGLLVSAASGPPGLSGLLIGIGLAAGAARGATSMLIVVPAVLAWLATLLLLTRTATNALGLVSNRFPRTGQVIVGLSGLVFYGAFQAVPAVLGHLDRGDRDQIARVLSLNPVGQLGRGARGCRRVGGCGGRPSRARRALAPDPRRRVSIDDAGAHSLDPTRFVLGNGAVDLAAVVAVGRAPVRAPSVWDRRRRSDRLAQHPHPLPHSTHRARDVHRSGSRPGGRPRADPAP